MTNFVKGVAVVGTYAVALTGAGYVGGKIGQTMANTEFCEEHPVLCLATATTLEFGAGYAIGYAARLVINQIMKA